MPSLMFARLRFPGSDEPGRELRWGIAGALFVAALLVISGVLYVVPFGKTTYTALLVEAGSVQVGDDVRVAGIPVGTVTGIELLPDQVRMRFSIERDVFVGADTSLEVRMLTAVGGHYLAMLPAGDKPLGQQTIPAERVRLPYSLMQVFQDAAGPVRATNGEVLRRNFVALEQALTDNPGVIRRLGDAVRTIVDLLDQQRGDVAAALSAAEEYLSTVDTTKSTIGRLVNRIGAVETILIDKREEINTALPLTIRLLSRIAALEPTYRTTLQPLADEFAKTMPELQRLGERLDELIGTIDDLSARTVDLAAQNGVTLDQSGTMFCLPLPGKGC